MQTCPSPLIRFEIHMTSKHNLFNIVKTAALFCLSSSRQNPVADKYMILQSLSFNPTAPKASQASRRGSARIVPAHGRRGSSPPG